MFNELWSCFMELIYNILVYVNYRFNYVNDGSPAIISLCTRFDNVKFFYFHIKLLSCFTLSKLVPLAKLESYKIKSIILMQLFRQESMTVLNM